MASVPNMRAAPSPVPTGKIPAAAGDPAGFAKQFAGIPEELIAAATLCSADAPAPDGAANDAGDAATAKPADAPSDAAQLAALAPLLQSLPAIVAAPAPPAAPATSKVQTVAAKTPAPTPPTPAAKSPTPPPPPPTAKPAATAQATGKIKSVRPEAESYEAGGESKGPEPVATLEAAGKEVIAIAKRVIEASLRVAGPALAEAAPKAVRAVASALDSVKDALPAALSTEAKALTADIALPTAPVLPAAPAAATAAPASPSATATPPADRPLDLANDAEWLDRLARDIAQAAGNDGAIRFRLHPQTLGHLHVELSQGDHGTSIRLTADTEQARAILADAQPKLVAEARAQGVRIAETHVDLSGSNRNASGDPRRQDDARQTPMIRTARSAAADADAPARPGRSRSDRYA